MENINGKNKYNNVTFRYPFRKEFISVIIPVYKDYKGLNDTLNSLKNQSLPENNFEIIVTNDGNDSNISTVCKTYKVKEVKITHNKGSYNARNKALEQSKGEHIAFTDADIIVSTDWLEKGMKLLEKYDYIAGEIIIDKSKVNSISTLYDYYSAFPIYSYITYDHFGPTANLFVKRRIFSEIGGFTNVLKSGGDLEFGNRVFLNKNYSQKYSKEIQVMHPPRNYSEIIKKIKRVSVGRRDLNRLYPDRFPYKKVSKRLEILQLVTPPKLFYKENPMYINFGLFLFSWWIRFVQKKSQEY